MNRIFILIFLVVLASCGLGEKDSERVDACSVVGDHNAVVCGSEGSTNEQDNSTGQSEEHDDACCDCFGNEEDGISDETCLELTQCSELYFEVMLDAEKRSILCPGNRLDPAPAG